MCVDPGKTAQECTDWATLEVKSMQSTMLDFQKIKFLENIPILGIDQDKFKEWLAHYTNSEDCWERR